MEWGDTLQPTVLLLINFFCLFKDVEKKVELKSPKLHTPGEVGTCRPPLQKSGNLDTSNPNLTQPCGRGGGPGVVALATREQWANNSPHRPAPTCRVGPQSPVPRHSLPHSGERASECNEALEQPPGQGLWGPRSVMEAMNQSGQPRNSGRRGPMRPPPLTSGGLTLEEITCRGWGPHLQYSFLIKLASLCGKFPSNVQCNPWLSDTWGICYGVQVFFKIVT